MDRFHDRTALVTGAGGPMGAAIARRLAREGANLLLNDISERRLEATRAALHDEFPRARIAARRASVLSSQEVEGLIEAGRELPPVDVLVNVVGGIRGSQMNVSFLEMEEQRFDDTFALNLKGMFHLVKRLAPGMRERGSGRIVNIASITFGGDPDLPEYGAAKAAVASLTRSLALAFAPELTVNCVAPGPIATRMVEDLDPAIIQAYVARVPLRRRGTPEDIAAAVAFLASDDAAYITGAILPVSGGIWPSL